MNNLRPSVDIMIVNWNAGDFLRRCLESIPPARTVEFELKRVVVVDNASSDGSLNTITRLDLPLTVIRNTENRGFSAACNQGASDSVADYLLFLNPDTCLYHDSLARPIRFMEDPGNAGVGICGIKLVDQVGEIATACARFPSLSIYVSQMFGLNRFFPRYFPRHFLLSEELMESREVDQVIGAFFLVRRDLFKRLEGFDERFFVYFEEVDLSLRAKQQGYASYYLSDAEALHVGRVSSRQISAMSLYYSLSSRLKYAMKHFRPWEARGLILLTFSVEFFTRMVWATTGSSVYGFRDILYAYKLLGSSSIHDGSSSR
jgi:N-acetylglucosaminyl-diphospho-decaprenol L-rhamnosyltransferase